MLCPKCNKTIEDNSIDCPFCGIAIEKYMPAEPFISGTGISKPETRETPAKIPYFKIGIVAAAVIFLWVIFKPKYTPEYAPEMTAVSFQSNESVTLSCDTKERCVVVYLAPW